MSMKIKLFIVLFSVFALCNKTHSVVIKTFSGTGSEVTKLFFLEEGNYIFELITDTNNNLECQTMDLYDENLIKNYDAHFFECGYDLKMEKAVKIVADGYYLLQSDMDSGITWTITIKTHSRENGVTTTTTMTTFTKPLTLKSGWNLVGMISENPKTIEQCISGNKDHIVSIWKWEGNNWSVYLTQYGPEFTEAYAKNKGFSILSSINPGEGFWVNCTRPVTINLDSSGWPSQAFPGKYNLVGVITTYYTGDTFHFKDAANTIGTATVTDIELTGPSEFSVGDSICCGQFGAFSIGSALEFPIGYFAIIDDFTK